jgi:rod shape-determining protein MreC
MYRILEFLYRYRAFLCFILLELVCFWMIVRYNNYQGTAYFNTSNYYAAEVLKTRNNIVSYFGLREVNTHLTEQNAKLLMDLNAANHRLETEGLRSDTNSDFLRQHQYDFMPAQVIKNSTRLPENFLTLDKGSEDGIEPDMGVIGPHGLVGRVKNVSKHYSTVISMLHSGMNVASRIKHKNIDATVVWDGIRPTQGKVIHVVRHHKIAKGDTLVTSEYNAVYPEGVVIGTIADFSLGGGSSDYDITINFSTDFTALSYVYVIRNKLKAERDSLEQNIIQPH